MLIAAWRPGPEGPEAVVVDARLLVFTAPLAAFPLVDCHDEEEEEVVVVVLVGIVSWQ